MKGDFSRSTFKRKNHYRSVRMQQGRVQLDSDWNEQADINNYHIETDVNDVIGRCGVPFHEKAGDNDIKNFEIRVDGTDFEIAPGRIYVDGILCENDALVKGSGQPDLPPHPSQVKLNADMPFIPFRSLMQVAGRTFLAFLDVWQRHITYLDDDNIREVALGGPDTATRAKTVWQVKLLEIAYPPQDAKCIDFPEFQKLVESDSGKLKAKTTDPGALGADPCILPPGGGYRRLKNQLYRVEIHDGSDSETATFKWSRDNGTVVVKWDGKIIDNNKLKVIDPGRSILSCFAAGKWVELTDDIHELWGLPGKVVKLTGVSGEEFTFEDKTNIGYIFNSNSDWNPKVRLWDSAGAVNINKYDKDWVQLGDDGIQVMFDSGTYRTGDYWLIPARTEKADIDWPKIKGEPEAKEPHGIKHHYCQLALLEADEDGKLKFLKDCRKIFPALTELTADQVACSPSTKCPDIKTVQSAIDMLCNREGIPENAHLKSLKFDCDQNEAKWPELKCDQVDMVFLTGSTEKMRINADGNVGIGTPTPGGRLHIGGPTPSIYLVGKTISNQDGLRVHYNEELRAGVIDVKGKNLRLRGESVASGEGATERLFIDLTNGNVGIGTTVPRNPLGIRASGLSEELISFEDPNGNTKWHINQNLDGNKPGLNFVETGVDSAMGLKSVETLGQNANGRLFIQAGGNVGIGTTTPAGRLNIVGSYGAGKGIQIDNREIKLRGDNEAHYSIFANRIPGTLTIEDTSKNAAMNTEGKVAIAIAKTSGNVGIGTTEPTAKLHLFNGNAHFEGTSTGSPTVNSDVYGLQIGPLHTRNATVGNYYPGIAFNHLLNYGGYNEAPQAWIGLKLYDTKGSERSSLVFATKEGTYTSGTGTDIPNPRMVIDPFGNVGIGTDSPKAPLHIPEQGLQIGTSTTAYNNFHMVSDSNGGLRGFRLYKGDYGYGTHLLTVLADGKVGIGTLSPAEKLDIDGAIRATGGGIYTTNPGGYAQTYLQQFGLISPGTMYIESGAGADLYLTDQWSKTGMLSIQFGKTVFESGNVGIGTTSPDNVQGWNKVLDVLGTDCAKLLVRSEINDVKTGIFSHSSWLGTIGRVGTESSHDLRLMVGYRDVMTLTTGGNVGIGTPTPEAKLHVAGNLKLDIGEGLEFLGENDYFGTNYNARIFRMIDQNGVGGEVDGGIEIEGFTQTDNKRKPLIAIKGAGNIGIGTKEPSAKLHLFNGNAHFEGTSTGSPTVNSDVYGLQIGPLHTRNATVGNYYPGIAFNHLLNYGGGTSYNEMPQAWIGLKLYDTKGSERSSLVFATKEGTDTSGTGTDIPNPRMVIDPFGNVGIGTDSPKTPLHIPEKGLQIGTSSLAYNNFHMVSDFTGSNRGFRLFNGNYEAGTHLLTVLVDGKVGIGTPAPGGKLDVQGDIRAGNSDIYFTKIDHELTTIGNVPGYAAIQNAADYGALLILGRAGTSKGRYVRLYDYLQVNGGMDVTGNVGIGTIDPKAKLEIRGLSNQQAYFVDDGQEDLRVLSSINRLNDGGIITIGGYGGPTGYIKTMAKDKRAGDIVIGNRRIATAARMEPGIVLDTSGNVGIGTTSPLYRLHVTNSGTFGGEKADGTSNAGNVPLVLQSDSTVFGILNSNSRQAFALNLEGNGGTTSARGYPVFYDKYDGIWHPSIYLRYGNVGIGTVPDKKFRLDVDGPIYCKGYESAGVDYSEYFETVDGAAIPVATSVVLTNEGTVRAAKKGDVPIGIVSENPSVLGNSYKEWPQKYLRDKYGRRIMEKVKKEMKMPKREKITKERQKVKKEEIKEEVARPEIVREKGKYLQKEKVEKITREVEVPLFEDVDLYDATGKKIIGKHRVPVMETFEEEVDVLDESGLPVLTGSGEFVTVERPKLNPEYDETKKYIPRSERPEWSCIGLLGQLPLRKGKAVAPTWVKIKDLSDDVELWLVK